MKKQKENPLPQKPVKYKRTRSIARSINASFALRLLMIFILLDFVILLPELRPFLETQEPITRDWLIGALWMHQPLLATQVAVWLLTLLFGAGGIRRKLRPLDDIASAARLIASPGGIDAKFHDLESAIDSVNPAREGARIRTGDKELYGLEVAVNKLIERMHETYRQQSRFVSDASHELRTPIAVIQGYANMLDRWGKTDEKVLSESIEAIKAESDRMKRLVEQLLFLARGDAGRIQIKIESINLATMMREVFDESVMIDSEHKYELKAEEPVLASGDADMLKQAARILVENAAKYTPSGEQIILKAEMRSGVPALTVQDYGIGMAQSDVAHVFERFYRADASRARESGGTGLGLAIAKWIADKHGGWFEVLSREELGTRISLCLPRDDGLSRGPGNSLAVN